MSGFTFKQFKVEHDSCAMKVSTDGILLGAWTYLKGANTLLDIGTGTGLLALMCKQRQPALSITAVEIDEAAYKQAQQNIASSPWPNITVKHTTIQAFKQAAPFDVVISNPPYLREREFINICKSIKYFEPKNTLVADKYDGLKYLHFIIKNYRNNLKKNGILALEIGNYQFKKVGFMLKNYRFRLLKSFNLINNDIRCIIATKI